MHRLRGAEVLSALLLCFLVGCGNDPTEAGVEINARVHLDGLALVAQSVLPDEGHGVQVFWYRRRRGADPGYRCVDGRLILRCSAQSAYVPPGVLQIGGVVACPEDWAGIDGALIREIGKRFREAGFQASIGNDDFTVTRAGTLAVATLLVEGYEGRRFASGGFKIVLIRSLSARYAGILFIGSGWSVVVEATKRSKRFGLGEGALLSVPGRDIEQ